MDSTSVFKIEQTIPTKLIVSSITVHEESCNRKDAFAQINSLSPDENGFSFEWENVTTQQIISTSTRIENVVEGKYNFYATDENGCKQLVTSVDVVNNLAPNIENSSINISPDYCEKQNGSITIENIRGNQPFAYTWYNKKKESISFSKDLQNAPADTYFLVVKDNNNCADTSFAITIPGVTTTLTTPVYKKVSVHKGDDALLSVENYQTGIYELYSSKNSSTPIQKNNTGVFIFGPVDIDTSAYVLFKDNSCVSPLAEIPIKIISKIKSNIPSAFTPNKDGLNDIFKIEYSAPVIQFHMIIYGRFGQKIFESYDITKGWDGTCNNVDQDPGTYIWIITLKDADNITQYANGTIVLIR